MKGDQQILGDTWIVTTDPFWEKPCYWSTHTTGCEASWRAGTFSSTDVLTPQDLLPPPRLYLKPASEWPERLIMALLD